MSSRRPLVLAIIDGFGHSENKNGNAIALAQKPFLDKVYADYPHTLLQASGQAVGLDWGEAGNSEVGHLSIGAGRIIRQYLSVINGSISDGSFYQNPVLLESMQRAKIGRTKLHVLGLLTSGSVHAYFKHLLAILEMAKRLQLPSVYLHLFTDGKDSGPKESLQLLKKIEENIENHPEIKIATVIGRNFSMERNNDWHKTEQAYNLFVQGRGQPTENFIHRIEAYHGEGITDDDLPPTVLKALPTPLITEEDSLLFFNFREDSMRQITRSFLDIDFTFFPRSTFSKVAVATLTKYFNSPQEKFAFQPILVKNNLAEWISLNKLKQFHITESEKYAHVTLFFNGLNEKSHEGETDFFLESPHNLAQHPEMRSQDIAEKVIEELNRDYYDFFVINFANADLIAHLGNINLVAKGIEKVDMALERIHKELSRHNGILIITADHGNAEALTYTVTGERETKHNSSPVPFILVDENYKNRQFFGQTSGILPDVAPTILELMNLPTPPEMTGQSLLSKII